MPRISLHFIRATMSRKGSPEGAKRIPGSGLNTVRFSSFALSLSKGEWASTSSAGTAN